LRAALEDNRVQRQALAAALHAWGLPVTPSQTNFLLVEFGPETARVEAELIRRGIVVRPVAGYGLADCLRITVGTAEENARLLVALGTILT